MILQCLLRVSILVNNVIGKQRVTKDKEILEKIKIIHRMSALCIILTLECLITEMERMPHKPPSPLKLTEQVCNCRKLKVNRNIACRAVFFASVYNDHWLSFSEFKNIKIYPSIRSRLGKLGELYNHSLLG